MSKVQALKKLAQKRRAARWPGYDCIEDFHDGIYECDFVSPYTKSAHNTDADIFVLLQDWSSSDRLQGPIDQDAIEFGHTPSLPTNRNLAQLLTQHFGVSLSDTYATNLFPFIKPGSLSARIKTRDLVRAAKEFAIPQIEIVRPRLVVCLGLSTFNALQRATGKRITRNTADAIAQPFLLGDAQVWCQSHTGALGRANRNRGGADQVSQDWAAMVQAIGRI